MAVAAVVVNPAAAAPPEVAVEREAVVVASPAAARAVAVVDVRPVVAAAKVVEAKVVAAVDVRPVAAVAARVVADKAVAVVDVRPAVVVDKVVEEADARLVVGAADPPVAAVEWEVEAAVVDVLPAGAAAAIASSHSSSGASRIRGAPFFC